MSTDNELTVEQQRYQDLIDSFPDYVIDIVNKKLRTSYRCLEDCPIDVLQNFLNQS
tara:strand:+ start:1503 stop:1670 length:168 start_codon:yes stop_codon:yes gene_type:complete